MSDTDPTAWATPDDIAGLWRPLTTAEQDRARRLIRVVMRAISRRWPNVERDRLIGEYGGGIDPDAVTDVIVFSVIPFLEHDPGDAAVIPSNAKSYQQTSGTESVSVTLDGPLLGTVATFAPWMVSVFEPATPGPQTGVQPVYSFPPDEDLGIDWIRPGWGRRAPQ